MLNIAIPNLLNGVSQQPANLRFPTQAEVQENAYSSVVDGLGKRPPTEHLAKIISGSAGDAFVHAIDRGDGSDSYIVVVRDNSIKVFDQNGVEKTVNVPDGTAYLDLTAGQVSAGVATAFKAVSIADFTFILNVHQTVSLQSATLSPTQANESLLWVQQGAYATKYQVLGTLAASFTSDKQGHTGGVYSGTNDGETFTDASHADTVVIASALKDQISAANPVSPPATAANVFTITRGSGNYVIHMSRTNPFDQSVSDGLGGNGLKLVKGSVQSFADLPSVAKGGMIVDVSGNAQEAVDNYWVKFVSKNGATAIGKGEWIETVGPGLAYKYTYTSMPWVLIRLPNGEFVFKPANGTGYNPGTGIVPGTDVKWSDRIAGDDSTNPAPSFVGRTINDIFLFRGRLGFLADESVILSESANYFNFWRTTAANLLDTDPIDVASSYPEITILRHAVSFSERLLLFSDKVQFVLDSTSTLSASTVRMAPIANYEILRSCRPVLIGQEVFFSFVRGGYSGVRAFMPNQADGTLLVAPEVSAQVPKYIPGNMKVIAGTTHENILACQAYGDNDSLYIYKWFDADGNRIQSSWSEWNFRGATIRGMAWLRSSMYLVLQRGTEGLFLERIIVEPNRKDTNSQFVTCLDRRSTDLATAGDYNSASDETTIQLPYLVQAGATVSVVQQATSVQEAGYELDVTEAVVGASTIKVRGNWEGKTVWVGEKYTMRYQFSTQYLRQSDGQRPVTLSTGRFQLRGMAVVYSNTSFFKAEVVQRYTNTLFDYTFSGNILGTGQAVIGNVPVEYGSFRFPLYGKNDELFITLKNDTHLPCNFLSAEIDASYESRSKRL
jgi:hypothetical protein